MGFVGSASAVRELVSPSGPGGSLAARLVCSVPIFLLTIFFAACGSSSTDPSDPPPPPPVNALPVVTSIFIKGTLPREPAQYATLGETVNITATVTDAETPVNQLTYEWSSSVGGTFGGNAATTTWTAPASLTGATPVNATLTLTVTERVDATRNNRVTATSIVDLHNSPKEVGDLALLFLEDFSKQLSADVVMRNFTATVLKRPRNGRRSRQTTRQTRSSATILGEPRRLCHSAVLARSGMCEAMPVLRSVSWMARNKSTGAVTNSGIDQVTAVLERRSGSCVPATTRRCRRQAPACSNTGSSADRYNPPVVKAARIVLLVALAIFYNAAASEHARAVNTSKARGDQSGYLWDAQQVYWNWQGRSPQV